MEHNYLRSVHQRSSKAESGVSTKRGCRDNSSNKKKKQQQQRRQEALKVVYISNPVHFKASASEFKGLVQQFTGQDSDVAELSKFADDGRRVDTPSLSTDVNDWASPSPSTDAPPQHRQLQEEPYKWGELSAAPFEAFDEFFTPQTLENLAAFKPTSLYYEPPPV